MSLELGSPNARTAQIKKFCALPPARGTALRLVTAEENSQALGEWTREECLGSGSTVPLQVDSVLQDHCETMARPIVALLGWCGDNGASITTKTLRARPANDDLTQAAQGIDGSQTGQVVQMQRHMEYNARLFFQNHVSQIDRAQAEADRYRERCIALEARIDALLAQNRDLLLERITSTIESAEAQAPLTDEARAKLLTEVSGMLGKAWPLVVLAVQRHMQQPPR